MRRLEQEVWSNSLVVASFYGPVHSANWWIAAVASTAIPALYCFTGGMRASLFTDVFQVGAAPWLVTIAFYTRYGHGQTWWPTLGLILK